MKRADKIKKRQERSLKRKLKRINKDSKYMQLAQNSDKYVGISWGRRKAHFRIYECEMGYSDCELRGYCNGDC